MRILPRKPLDNACDDPLPCLVELLRLVLMCVQRGRKSRSIPAAIARALRARDGGCRFKGCDRTRFCAGHHVKHWVEGGETKLGNLLTLCTFHHTLLHEGGFGVTATDDGVFAFTRPDGSRIPESSAL